MIWYKPQEKLPPDGKTVKVMVSGRIGLDEYLDHDIQEAEFYSNSGWDLRVYGIEDGLVYVDAWTDDVPSH